ncbi:uncharacterized protein [Epargyreus clarus]|uniref:uncharacterized protein n=1 Tax=Epargyreus clarus TaxID=520877 RepID=UPI003C2BE5FB
MDDRAAKLANARKKLRDHQEKKSVHVQKDEGSDTVSSCGTPTSKNDREQPSIPTDDSHLPNEFNNETQVHDNVKFAQYDYPGNNHDVPILSDEKCYSNVTEILISNKTNLEIQNRELQSKIAQLEHILSKEVNENNFNLQKISALELKLNETQQNYSMLTESMSSQNALINELKNQIKQLQDENNNLIEQQEFTKTMLTTKEMEVAQLDGQVSVLRRQLDVTTLQLQQLTTDTNVTLNQNTGGNENNELLKEKIAMLEHQLENSVKDKDHISSHYEHYVGKLNEQIRIQATKNEALSVEVKGLYNRESALIEQISQMEIRMQNYRRQSEAYAESHNSSYIQELKDKVTSLQVELDELRNKYNDLQKQYENKINESTIQEHNETTKVQEFSQENITKLNADIASDKVAAQRATEQNKKLKTDIEELEQIVVKLGKDKLELTEKLSHENQLNKQLMLKLAEIDETSKQMQTKLMAKDEEMIRLQTNYRDIENKHEALLENILQSKENAVSVMKNNVTVDLRDNVEEDEVNKMLIETNGCSGDCATNTSKELRKNDEIPKEDAMFKLQERFMNIMDQVANLSDEKHRLEHIILQLQTETDTICEYVALYQQQRSLLKKRDEERSAQIKSFQIECDEVKRNLEELSYLFLKLAQDKDLRAHLQVESRQNDIERIQKLLDNLLNSSLIHSKCKSLEFKNIYPCNCCSGQLIDV